MEFSYGAALPDQATPIINHIGSVLTFYADCDKFIVERAALEREYGLKLQKITRAMAERKTKRGDALWVGESIGKGGGIGASCSFEKTISALLNASETTAASHITLADKLATQVSETLKERERRKEIICGRYSTYYDEIQSQKESYNAERAKAKSKYQTACDELEQARQKHERSVASGDRHVDRSAKALNEVKAKVGEEKNALIVKTGVANAIKERFFQQDLPAFEDRLQELHLSSLKTLHSILTTSEELVAAHHSRLTNLSASSLESLKSVDLTKDIELYVEHNTRVGGWKEPEGLEWEPAQGFYEEGNIDMQEGPKIVMQNKLAKTLARLDQLSPVLDIKQSELNQLGDVVSRYSQDHSLGDPDQVMESLLGNLTEVATLSNQVTASNVVASILQEALGDEVGAQAPHDFKKSNFAVPTQCAFCAGSIWGLGKQGKTCKGCGVTVHSKCEFKIPSNCRSSTPSTRRASTSLARTTSLSRSISSASSSAPSTYPSIAGASRVPPSIMHEKDVVEEEAGGGELATVMFDYEASSEFEITVSEGEQVTITELDDGSGWTKIRNASGSQGLCPSTYVQAGGARARAAAVAAPAATPAAGGAANGGSGDFVTVLYDYAAQGSDELSLVEGERLELTVLGRQYGDGWWEGIKGGQVGIFPSNYTG